MTLTERATEIAAEYDTINEPHQTIGALSMRIAILERKIESMKKKFHDILPYHKIE